MALEIVLQYFDDCPSWEKAEAELKQAADALAVDAHITYEKIESQAEAERKGFRGSPTILVGGRDPFADDDAPIGLSCRIYRTGGKASGSPGVDALRVVLEELKA